MQVFAVGVKGRGGGHVMWGVGSGVAVGFLVAVLGVRCVAVYGGGAAVGLVAGEESESDSSVDYAELVGKEAEAGGGSEGEPVGEGGERYYGAEYAVV